MRLTKFGGPALWLAAAILLLLPTGARAHRVNVFAYVEGDTVHVECGYSRSDRVRFGDIEVADPATKEVFLTGKTDDKGNFSFPVPPAARERKADLHILLRAGEGHQNDWTVKAEEYLTAAPLTGPLTTQPTSPPSSATPAPGTLTVQPLASPATAAPSLAGPVGPSGVAPAATSGPVPAPANVLVSMDPAALQAVVEAAVEKKIAPIRKMLLDEKEKGPGLTEIAGGIGYLVGLAGLLAYARSRKAGPGA
uniref:Nickel transport protein n=1 Tax=Desulfovibrio sp. U5L TaxID=596152 RepID=I2Q0R9_9BACT